MDFFELAKILFTRIQKLEPENAVKIMGCIFLKEPGLDEMLRLAIGSDSTLLSKIIDAKIMLGNLSSSRSCISDNVQIGSEPQGTHTFSSPYWNPSQEEHSLRKQPEHYTQEEASFPVGGMGSRDCRRSQSLSDMRIKACHYFNKGYCKHGMNCSNSIMLGNLSSSRSCISDNVQIGSEPQGTHTFSSPYWNPSQEEHSLRKQSEHYTQEEASFPVGGMGSRDCRRSQSLSDLRIKACHYFNKGYCKHGMNCRYSHVLSTPDGYSNMFSSNVTDHGNDDHTLTPKSLEKLGMEIVELLRSKRGMPISIASLPLLYYEMYGTNLQADGYLTESQRHGKAVLSLSMLLSHFRKNIRLIERPHGQHSVILAEDAPKYMEYRNDRSDLGSASAISSSHQIYLTFPAESTFTEDDVSKYFSQFGRVRDVRIPCQDKRMFGFVSFLHPETVSMILMKRNPHYICGARVLVKPYREKSKLVDRTYPNKIKAISSYPSLYIEMDHDVHSEPCESDNPRLVTNHLLGDKQMSMDFDRTLPTGLNLTSMTAAQQYHLPHGKDDLKASEGPGDFILGHFSHGFDSQNSNSTNDDQAWQTSNLFIDQESSQIELPESPFAYASGEKSIFAVI